MTKYSPNKTYSGVIGSYVFAIFSVPLTISIGIISEKNTLILSIFVFFISTISQLGDICISYFKRISKIKDTGKIIPGHGGLLDRIDGMIFVIPIIFILIFTVK